MKTIKDLITSDNFEARKIGYAFIWKIEERGWKAFDFLNSKITPNSGYYEIKGIRLNFKKGEVINDIRDEYLFKILGLYKKVSN